METVETMRRRTDVPVVVADHLGLIAEVNDRFLRVFGWERSEIVGAPLTAIIPPDLRDSHHLGFSRFLTTGKSAILDRPLNLKAVTKAGAVFEAEHHIVAELREGQWAFAAAIRPLAGP